MYLLIVKNVLEILFKFWNIFLNFIFKYDFEMFFFFVI